MSEAKQIRSELKEQGWNARQVSVRSSRSSVRVEIKDGRVPLSKVASIAKKYESISRCAVTGDILSGGNTYIFVNYADEVIRFFVDQLLEFFPKHPGMAIDFGIYEIMWLRDGTYTYGWQNPVRNPFNPVFHDAYSCAKSFVINWLSKE